MSARSVPPLHLVTDDRVLATPDFLERAERTLQVGKDRVALHLRGPRTDGRRLWELAHALAPLCAESGCLLIVNDRVDVALLVGADGVHLGARSLPAEEVYRVLYAPHLHDEGRAPLLGRSVHGREEIDALPAADRARLAYLFVGTIFPTPSHPGRPGAGPDMIREVRGAAGDLPLVGIGGITSRKVEEVMEAGASGVAVLREIWDAEAPGAAVERLLDVLG